jgi:hypothetical protein
MGVLAVQPYQLFRAMTQKHLANCVTHWREEPGKM